jgi:nucleoside-diphosphate-sugar epimerase
VGGTVADPKADGEGNINLINAAMEAGVKKFVLVTSIGTGDSKDAPSEKVYEVLKPVLLEKEKAENALMVRALVTSLEPLKQARRNSARLR